MDRVIIDVENHVAHIRLNRPDKLNAIDLEMFKAIVEAGDVVRSRPDVRAVVLSGEGRGFCAGVDLDGLGPSTEQGFISHFYAPKEGAANLSQYAVLQWRRTPVPVIAALHGMALGGGLLLCLGMDIRVTHPETKLGFLETKWGLVPDMAGIPLLRSLVRPDVLSDLVYRSRVVSGAEGVALGLATLAHDNPIEHALSIARDIAGMSPDAICAAKRLMMRQEISGLDEALIAETQEQTALFASANHQEAVSAGKARRPPVYDD